MEGERELTLSFSTALNSSNFISTPHQLQIFIETDLPRNYSKNVRN